MRVRSSYRQRMRRVGRGRLWGLLADRERRVYLSTAGRDWAAGFTWERSVETLEGALRLAVGRGAAV